MHGAASPFQRQQHGFCVRIGLRWLAQRIIRQQGETVILMVHRPDRTQAFQHGCCGVLDDVGVGVAFVGVSDEVRVKAIADKKGR